MNKFSVNNTCKRLLLFLSTHYMLAKVMSGKIISISSSKLKTDLGYNVYCQMECCKKLLSRYSELKLKESENDYSTKIICDEIKYIFYHLFNQNKSDTNLLGAIASINDYLKSIYIEYIKNSDVLVDAPSVRIMKEIINELDEMNMNYVQNYFQNLDDFYNNETIVILQKVFSGKKVDNYVKKPRRNVECKREENLKTFNHTRNYESIVNSLGLTLNPFSKKALEYVWIQRDELDAVETFANVFFDLDEQPFQLYFDLSRFIWDESRHSELGNMMLIKQGYNPLDFPCSTIGINVRSSLLPEYAFAQISIFGELNIVGPMNDLSKEGYANNSEIGPFFDFINHDEVMHIKIGRKWIQHLFKNKNFKQIEDEVKIKAVEMLKKNGVIGEEYENNISREEIFKLIGGE